MTRALRFSPGRSHKQTRALLWIGFGGLLLLMAVFGLSAMSFLYQVEIRQERIRKAYVERDRDLEKLRSDIYLSGTYARDFLLDATDEIASAHRERFFQMRAEIERSMADYRLLLLPGERQPFAQLTVELEAYFGTLEPALRWSPAERRARGYRFVADEVLPRRMLAVGLADRIQTVSQGELEESSQSVSEMFASFRVKLLVLLLLTTVIGIVLASLTMWRLLHLERESERSFEEVSTARAELKQLSAELVSAQESERRRISRELHDEVGQVLSATMLAVGNLRSSIRENQFAEAARQLDAIEEMTERNARVVRNLSLLLRPTMLDDLGLVPALKWLGREVSRNHHLAVHVGAEDFPESLPDEHRTCVYRVVQEAVRNVCRHAGAQHLEIALHQTKGCLQASVQDDGKGFDAGGEAGMGILGMEERIIRLGGKLTIQSEPGKGTTVRVELPLPEPIDETAGDYSAAHEMSPLRTA